MTPISVETQITAIVAVWLTGKYKAKQASEHKKMKIALVPFLARILLFSVIIWPLVYFIAGYFIAWQFAEVRLFYSGSTEMASFYAMMKENFASGLYFFQIFRGVLWILIALFVFNSIKGSMIHKGIILGLLLAFLGSSGLLIPNPVMPFMVRMGHLLETATSSFLWGLLLAWGFAPFTSGQSHESNISVDSLFFE